MKSACAIRPSLCDCVPVVYRSMNSLGKRTELLSRTSTVSINSIDVRIRATVLLLIHRTPVHVPRNIKGLRWKPQLYDIVL